MKKPSDAIPRPTETVEKTIGHLNPVMVRVLRRIDVAGMDFNATAHMIASLLSRGAVVRRADGLLQLTDAGRDHLASLDEEAT